MGTYRKAGEPWLYDATTDALVGVLNRDGSESYFAPWSLDANGNPTGLVGSGLSSTGYDQTSEIQQYLNDTVGGVLHADFGPGDFIITGDITVHSRRVAEYEGNYGYGLNMRGVSPNVTRILDARADKSTPAILITEPVGVDVGNRAIMAHIGGFSLLACNTSGVINPFGTLGGTGMMVKASSGTGYGAFVMHSSKLDRLLFSGYDYPLSLDDCTQVELSHIRFTEFLTAVRLGMNCDTLNFNHCAWGSESFGSNYRNSAVCVENKWDSGIGTTGGANNLKFENGWVMKVGTFFRNINPTITDSTINFIGMYFENVLRYYYADVSADLACRVFFDSCHFSHMDTNDHTSSVKSNGGFGSKIQFGSTGINTAASNGPLPYLTIKNCSGDGTPSTALVTFNNRTGRISWEDNEIPVSASHGHVRCIRDGWESWRTLANTGTPAIGRWHLGDDQAAGLKIIQGDPILVTATITSGATYNLDQRNGTVFELTLPDGNCTIDYSAYSPTPPSPLLAAGTEIDVLLIVPASITAPRTITWGARVSMSAGTLAFTATEQGKRAQIKLRAPKDSGNVVQQISRDPVFI